MVRLTRSLPRPLPTTNSQKPWAAFLTAPQFSPPPPLLSNYCSAKWPRLFSSPAPTSNRKNFWKPNTLSSLRAWNQPFVTSLSISRNETGDQQMNHLRRYLICNSTQGGFDFV